MVHGNLALEKRHGFNNGKPRLSVQRDQLPTLIICVASKWFRATAPAAAAVQASATLSRESLNWPS